MSEQNNINQTEKEIKDNNEKIKNDSSEIFSNVPNGGYNFEMANSIKEIKVKDRKEEAARKKKTFKTRNIVITFLVIFILLYTAGIILGIKYIYHNETSTFIPTSDKINASKILAGKTKYDVEIAIDDVRIEGNQIEVKFMIQNNGKNTFYPLLENTELSDDIKGQYSLNGLITDDIQKGIPSGKSIKGLISFKNNGNQTIKNYTINITGSDIEHFTFDYTIPFSIK